MPEFELVVMFRPARVTMKLFAPSLKVAWQNRYEMAAKAVPETWEAVPVSVTEVGEGRPLPGDELAGPASRESDGAGGGPDQEPLGPLPGSSGTTSDSSSDRAATGGKRMSVKRWIVWLCAGCDDCEPAGGRGKSLLPCSGSPSMDGGVVVLADDYDRLEAEVERLHTALQSIADMTGHTDEQRQWARDVAVPGGWRSEDEALEAMWSCMDDYYVHREQMRKIARAALASPGGER